MRWMEAEEVNLLDAKAYEETMKYHDDKVEKHVNKKNK
jgi:hypothetical protein